MSLGFIMLCHTALGRAAQVARHWAERGCPVVIHVDARVKRREHDRLLADLDGLANVRFSRRHTCEWGTWGLVKATQDAAQMMLDEFPSARHVFLASGSCLPLRPVEELRAYLDERPRADFIESVTTADVGWTVGGLDAERFTLRFPFSWRKRRRLFDIYVRLQRHLGLRRRIPSGLVPHLGSQWWCLTRNTLSAILSDPRRAEFDRYFRRVWIPDESYFQTLVRLHSTTVESRSLTLPSSIFKASRIFSTTITCNCCAVRIALSPARSGHKPTVFTANSSIRPKPPCRAPSPTAPRSTGCSPRPWTAE